MTEFVKLILLVSLLILVSGFFIRQAVLHRKKQLKRKKYLKSNLASIDRMSGHEFENYLEAIFRNKGYHSKVTPGSGDFGADLVMEDEGQIIVIQAKRYKNKVGIKAVQEIYSAKALYKADEAFVITNSYFTSSAKKLATTTGVQLVDRDTLWRFKNRR